MSTFLVSGQVPWHGVAPPMVFHDRLQYGRTLPIDEHKVANDELCNLLRAGMAREPLGRPQTSDAFRSWLLRVQKPPVRKLRFERQCLPNYYKCIRKIYDSMSKPNASLTDIASV